MKQSVLAVVTTLATAASCTDADFELSFEPLGPDVEVYDDGGPTVYLVGCAETEFLSCAPGQSAQRLRVVVDGITYQAGPSESVPELPKDVVLDLFDGGDFFLEVPRPTDGQLLIELAGASAQVSLRGGFAIEPPANLSRAQPIELHVERQPGVDRVELLDIARCGQVTHFGLGREAEAVPGTLELDPTGLTGTCEHELRVSQIQDALATPAALPVEVYRTEVLAITTTP